jgi:hypothetical protein
MRSLHLKLYADLLRKLRQFKQHQVPATGVVDIPAGTCVIDPVTFTRQAFVSGSPSSLQGERVCWSPACSIAARRTPRTRAPDAGSASVNTCIAHAREQKTQMLPRAADGFLALRNLNSQLRFLLQAEEHTREVRRRLSYKSNPSLLPSVGCAVSRSCHACVPEAVGVHLP